MQHNKIVTGRYVKVESAEREQLHLYVDGERIATPEDGFGYGSTRGAVNVARAILRHFIGGADETGVLRFHRERIAAITPYSSFSIQADEVYEWHRNQYKQTA